MAELAKARSMQPYIILYKITLQLGVRNLPKVFTSASYAIYQSHIHGLSNRAIFNDLEDPQTQISRSDHSLTLNISKMAADTVIVTMEGE